MITLLKLDKNKLVSDILWVEFSWHWKVMFAGFIFKKGHLKFEGENVNYRGLQKILKF